MKANILIILFLCFLSVKIKSQNDTLHYEIVLHGRSEYQQKQPLILTNDKEYFDFYFNSFGTYPQNFRFDFDKEMIVVFFKTLSSGSLRLMVDHIVEKQDKIEVSLKTNSPGIRSHDMNPSYIAVSLKKSDKEIITN